MQVRSVGRLKRVMGLFLALGLSVLAMGKSKEEKVQARQVEAAFARKYVVVLQEGLAFGVCANRPDSRPDNMWHALHVTVQGAQASYAREEEVSVSGLAAAYKGTAAYMECGTIIPEPLHIGDVLMVKQTAVQRPKTTLMLELVDLTPHTITRGVGAFQHQSAECGEAVLWFRAADAKAAQVLAQQWLAVFPSIDSAVEYKRLKGM